MFIHISTYYYVQVTYFFLFSKQIKMSVPFFDLFRLPKPAPKKKWVCGGFSKRFLYFVFKTDLRYLFGVPKFYYLIFLSCPPLTACECIGLNKRMKFTCLRTGLTCTGMQKNTVRVQFTCLQKIWCTG